MKKNNKGFLLVETLVVSTFCLTVLVILFLQFRTLIINYNNSFKYNTVEGIYNLKTIRECVDENSVDLNIDDGNNQYHIFKSDDSNFKTNLGKCAVLMEQENINTLIYTDKKLSGIKGTLNKDNNLSPGMKKFISVLKDSDKNNMLIAEFSDKVSASEDDEKGYSVETYAQIAY